MDCRTLTPCFIDPFHTLSYDYDVLLVLYCSYCCRIKYDSERNYGQLIVFFFIHLRDMRMAGLVGLLFPELELNDRFYNNFS
jgi:hypothetical protein